MGFFDGFRRPDINEGGREFGSAPGAVLLDVRSAREYGEGHIPGSRNVPLQDISGSQPIPAGKSTPLYVYCYSGARSGQAAAALRRMGYTNVKNIGGIASWRGTIER